MSSVNKVLLIGNLGADPVVRHTQDGKPIVSFGLATSESWRDKGSGEKKEKTEWHNVVIFNEGLAKLAEQYLKKGATVYIEGQLQTRKYTNKEGIEVRTTEVVLQAYRGELTFLGGKPSASSDDDYGAAQEPIARKPTISERAMAAQAPLRHDLDDENPF